MYTKNTTQGTQISRFCIPFNKAKNIIGWQKRESDTSKVGNFTLRFVSLFLPIFKNEKVSHIRNICFRNFLSFSLLHYRNLENTWVLWLCNSITEIIPLTTLIYGHLNWDSSWQVTNDIILWMTFTNWNLSKI